MAEIDDVLYDTRSLPYGSRIHVNLIKTIVLLFLITTYDYYTYKIYAVHVFRQKY